MVGRPGPRFCVGALTFALLLLPTCALLAQDTLSFSKIDVSLGVHRTIHKGPVDQYWRSGPAFQAAALTRFGIGSVRVALEVANHASRDPEIPGYLSLFPSLEWGLATSLPLGLSGYAGTGLGAYWMRFTESENQSEMEMAVGATALLRRTVVGSWTMGAGVHVRRVLLYDQLPQAALFLEVGRAAVRTPDVVRRALLGTPIPNDAVAGTTLGEARARAHESGAQLQGRQKDLDDLRDAGVTHLSGVTRALFDWDQTTVDRRTSWMTPEGLAPFDDVSSHVSVDGIPVPLDLLGARTLDRLPLSVGDLDSLHAVGVPALQDHRFRRGGSLRFITRYPRSDGFGIAAEGVLENPTDDPGPFRYLEGSAPNVDKLGGSYGVAAGGARGRLAAVAGVKYVSDFVTDAGLGARPISLRDPNVHYPMIPTYAGWASVRFAGERGRHTLRASRSFRDDYLFLPMVGFEVPTEIHSWHVGAAGERAVGRGLDVRYQTFAASDELTESVNDLGIDLDLRSVRRGVGVELGGEGRVGWVVGGGIDGDRVRSRFLTETSSRATTHAHASTRGDLGVARVGVQGELRWIEGELAGDLAANADIDLGDRGRASLVAWRSASSPDEQTGYWGLHDRGYTFLASLGIAVSELDGRRERVEEGAHLEVAWSLGALRLTPFVRATRVAGLTIAQPTFVQGDGPRPEHDGPLQLSGAASGSVLMAGADLGWVPGAKVEVQARYRWLETTSENAFFRSAWASTPAHRFLQRVVWSPRPDLSIAWSVEGRSSTSWAAFTRMGRARLAGSVVTDVSVDKTLWEGRVHLCGRVSDITDQERPLHPIGTAPGLTFTVCGRIRAGS